MTQYVQLSSDTTKVIAWFAGPQPVTSDKPGYTEIADNDPRYVAWQQAGTAQQQYAQALIAGVAVISSSNPTELNGTYDWSEAGLLKLTGLQVSLNSQKNLPNGATTVKLKDMAGAWHTFGEADITNLDVALRDYVYGWDLYLGGQEPNPPTAPLTIA